MSRGEGSEDARDHGEEVGDDDGGQPAVVVTGEGRKEGRTGNSPEPTKEQHPRHSSEEEDGLGGTLGRWTQ